MKELQRNAPLLTNSIQMLRKDSEGDGERKTTKPEYALVKKIIASECFGLSRVRCAGWCGVNL